MIKVYSNNKNICECCDNDSSILIDFTEDTKPNNLGTRVYLCEDCMNVLYKEIGKFMVPKNLKPIYKKGGNNE
jgi:hypothetical protein